MPRQAVPSGVCHDHHHHQHDRGTADHRVPCLVTGEAILGANVFRDFFASVRDIVGGRSGAYEKVLRSARDEAVQEMMAEAKSLGANAVVGVDLDYEVIGKEGSMLMVSASGTAVKVG